MKAIIVDDELDVIVPVLERYLQKYAADIELCGQADNVEHAYQLILNQKPDLVFLDVEIGNETGFDLMQKFAEPEFMVVFVTGFEKYAARAIRLGALDFLQKPVDQEEFVEVIQKVRRERNKREYKKQIELVIEAFNNLKQNVRPSRLSIPDSEGILFIDIEKLIRLEAEGINTQFFLKEENRKIISSRNIGTYIPQLEPYDEFMKTHRSHLINLKEVKRYLRGDKSVVMTDRAEIPVSEQYREELLLRLRKL